MRLQLWFLLLFPICSCLQMIEFWGIVQDSSNPVAVTRDWIQCRDQCYVEKSCLAVRELDATENCQVFRFGELSSVEIVNSTTGGRIAIKKNTDSCPATLADMVDQIPSEEKDSNDLLDYSYSMSLTNSNGRNFWNINVDYFFECPGNFMSNNYILVGSIVSKRGDTRVCISVYRFEGPYFDNRVRAVNSCAESGFLGMTGPYDIAEGDRMVAKANSITICNTFVLCNFWIDGDRTISNTFLVNDTTLDGIKGYNWSEDPETTPIDQTCVYLGTKGYMKGLVYTGKCTLTRGDNNGSFSQNGAICRAEPVYDFHN